MDITINPVTKIPFLMASGIKNAHFNRFYRYLSDKLSPLKIWQ